MNRHSLNAAYNPFFTRLVCYILANYINALCRHTYSVSRGPFLPLCFDTHTCMHFLCLICAHHFYACAIILCMHKSCCSSHHGRFHTFSSQNIDEKIVNSPYFARYLMCFDSFAYLQSLILSVISLASSASCSSRGHLKNNEFLMEWSGKWNIIILI
jgi:hypothetical protein